MTGFHFGASLQKISVESGDHADATATPLRAALDLGARVFLALLFLFSGLRTLGSYAATTAFMESNGVPGVLLPLVITIELAGGVAVLLGWRVRLFAFLLGGFSLLTGVLLHSPIADPSQWDHFLKNVAIAGGFLLLMTHGAGPLSFDRRAGR